MQQDAGASGDALGRERSTQLDAAAYERERRSSACSSGSCASPTAGSSASRETTAIDSSSADAQRSHDHSRHASLSSSPFSAGDMQSEAAADSADGDHNAAAAWDLQLAAMDEPSPAGIIMGSNGREQDRNATAVHGADAARAPAAAVSARSRPHPSRSASIRSIILTLEVRDCIGSCIRQPTTCSWGIAALPETGLHTSGAALANGCC
jgi:hypothetical protein